MKKMILIAAIALLSSCTNSDKAIDILKNEGYSDIKITGYKPFSCSENDMYSTGFCATNKAGNRVCGVVCGGYLKGYTIRYN